MWNVFEDPWLLLIVGIVTLIIGVWVRNNVSEKNGLLAIILGVLIVAAGFGLDYLVKTDYEQVRGIILTCRDAAVARDARTIEPLISQRYKDVIHPNKAVFMEDINGIFRSAAISKVRFQELTVNIFQGTAQAKLDMAVFLDPKSSYAAAGGLFFAEMTVGFQKEAGGIWRITNAEVVSINNDRTDWRIAH